LGLAITYQLVHLLGGDIWVESDKNTGSVFFFTLPFKVNPGVHYEKEFINEEKPLKRMQSWKGKKILLVDDVLHVYEYLQALLDQTGVQISYVNSGAKAIRFMRRYKDIDLILLDIQMPEMNGIKVAEEIRKIDPDVPIIAQSANALKGDKERYLKKGCHDYISKPIEPELLFQKMNKYLSVPIKR
jgi:hypothetical protein